MFAKRQIDKGLNKFGNAMGDLQDFGREIERVPEKFVKGSGRVAVSGTKLVGEVGVGVLKELSGIVAYGAREATGGNKRKQVRKSNLAKGWFD